MGLVKLLALATIFEILGQSCTVDDVTPDGGERIDARVLSPVPGLRFSPDGLGYCCPIASASCDCVGTGGFVPIGDPRRCPTICDAPPMDWHGSVPDEHGCPRVVISGDHCCNCPDTGTPPVDAGDGSFTSPVDGSAG